MPAEDFISPAQFAAHKAIADKTGKAQRVSGTDIYVPASPAAKKARKQGVQDFHASLVPMKETVRASGFNFPRLSAHLKSKGDAIGAPRNKHKALAWAAAIHDKDPKNFLKNIGMVK